MTQTASVLGCSVFSHQLWVKRARSLKVCEPHLVQNVLVRVGGLTPGGRHTLGVSKNYYLIFREVKGAPKKCIFKQCFAFVCINLKIKSYENKNGRKTIWNSVWRKIHEMQICDRINDRSIFFYLISMRSWLIVLLLNNYPEFTQGLESRALGCGSFLCLASSSRPLETG